MKRIKSLTVQGFRGFNKLHGPMEFDENITLIYGQNSYGKTSISEALEWLLYGITSKMEAATNNKTEYQGSYRNIHFPDTDVPFVEAVFILDDGSEAVYRGELQEGDEIQRYLNKEKVDNWPWALDAINDPKPFILQHALKNLLLASPSDRYQGFTKLIGEEELGNLQEHFISLSTKYDPPKEVKDFRASFSDLEERLSNQPKLEKLSNLTMSD
jgi:AAA domain